MRRPVQVLLGIVSGLATAGLATLASVHALGLAATAESRIWLPSTPNGDLALAEQRFAARQQLSTDDAAAIRQLAERMPLANEPFAWAGYSALLEGDQERAVALLTEAKARRPRSRLARMALMQVHATRGELDPLAAELVPLLRLEPELVRPLTEQWVKAAKTPEDIAVLARILRTDPNLFANVAESAARDKLSPALLQAFLDNNPSQDESRNARLDRLLLLALVEQGDIAGARRAWERRAGSGTGSGALVYNGDFSDHQSPPPFNWDLDGAREGVAEYRREGGVFIDYFGRGNSPFLRQLVTLRPGSYRLSVSQQVETGSGSGLVWKVTCANSGSVLQERAVRGSGANLDERFLVPAGCPAQWIALEGRGALRSGEGQRLVVTRVAITQAGAS